ncbi:MAG: APC family permease [Candidatus Omnitrophota bacterium]
MTNENTAELPRVLGLFDVVGIVIGTVIGSGIFIVPAAVAAQVKSPLLMLAVWAVGGLLTFFGALSLSELGTAFPQAGGMYVYLREAYGPLVSFLFGWTLFLVIDSGSIATLSVAFSSKYLPFFFDLTPVEKKLVSAALITFLVAVNYAGVRWGARLQNLLTIIKFGAILAVSSIVFLFAKGNPSNFVSAADGGVPTNIVSSFGVALVAVLWAYKGWEVATFTAGEIKNPQKTIYRGFLIGTLLIISLYIITNLAYLYVFPASQIATSTRIATDAMNAAVGPISAALISFVILFSITGAANGNVLTAPRVLFAMSRDGLFFKKLGAVHPKYLTPYSSIIAIGAWSIILCISGTFEQLFTYVIFGQWLFFVLTMAAVIILRKKRPDVPRPYRTWGYPYTPIFFILSALYISINSMITQFWNSMAGLGIIVLGIPVYLYWTNLKKRKNQ